MRKKSKKTSKAPKKKPALKKVVPPENEQEILKILYPLDLPLSDTWFHYADLMAMFKVSRSTVRRYVKMGILLMHKLGRGPMFNKTYVDWMIENGRRNSSWILAFLTSAESF